MSFERAESFLFYGKPDGSHKTRQGFRWQNKPAVAMVNDFDHVLRALYADENRVSVKHRQKHLDDPTAKPPTTRLDDLKRIWHSLLPHRKLIVLDNTVKVEPDNEEAGRYSASDLSDGERVIFYLLGQCLLVKPGCLIIIDEPELHIHKAILTKMWDAIESSRSDCVFLYLTHDLEFATARHGAQKVVVQSYQKTAGTERWEVTTVPENTGIPEDIVAKVLGSRQPVLFVEGTGASLDASIYRRVYSGRTVIPVGSCESVIHSVKTFNSNGALHRIECSGLIDKDDRTAAEAAQLTASNIRLLPVSEVENLLLLPEIFLELAKLLHFDQVEAHVKLEQLKAEVFKQAEADIDRYALDFARRRIDRQMKGIGLTAKDVAGIQSEFEAGVRSVNVQAIYDDGRRKLQQHLDDKDYSGVLSRYDNKGLLAVAAQILGLKDRGKLEELVGRALRTDTEGAFSTALINVVPQI